MAEEKQHHHLFHHDKEADNPQKMAGNMWGEDQYEKAKKEEKHKEHLGEAGGLASGAFAMHEKREGKKDPEHERRHKLEEEIAGASALAEEDYALHEHHDIKEAKDAGPKHHHLF